jgi:predicted transcriptional regulator
MDQWEHVLYSVVQSDKELGDVINSAFQELNISISEFCTQTGMSESTVYKITSGHRDNIQLDVFRKLVSSIRQIEQGQAHDERTVAVISNRKALEGMRTRQEINGMTIRIKGYPSATVEEAIRQGILAERDGVNAIICGPITAYTIEEVEYTPVLGLDITSEQINDALTLAIEKTVDTTDD